MKALFWKETRENVMWALLAAACVVGALFYGLRSDPERMSYGNNYWMGMLSPQVLLVTTFGFPLIGAAFGFLQILTELRRDQWAFLVHRPITRSQVFWGKAVPGLFLYVLATVPPFLLVAWWASLPGSLPAPFDWGMTRAGLMDALTGAGFYFAALWTGISQGKWYGRRLLPLVAACYGALMTKGYMTMDTAAPNAMITLLAIIPAALVTFQTFGIFKKQAWWGRVCTGLALLLAASVLWGWLTAAWFLAFPRKPYSGTEIRVTSAGQFVKATQQGSWIQKVTTITGEVLQPGGGRAGWSWEDFLNSNYLNINLRDQPIQYSYRQPDQYFQQIYANDMNVLWYFVKQQNRFVSYDARTKMVKGYLGPKGFAGPDEADQAGQFTLSPNGYRYQGLDSPFVADGMLYAPQLSRNEVKVLYRPVDGETLLSGALMIERNMREGPKDYAVATNKAVQAFTGENVALWTLPQPENLKSYESILFSRLADRSKYFLIYQPKYNLADKVPKQLYTLGPDGRVLERIELPLAQKYKPKLTWKTVRERFVYPLGQLLWEHAYGLTRNYLKSEPVHPIWKYPADQRDYMLKLWGIALGMGVVCALASLPFLPRLELSRAQQACWLAFILFYSFAGLFVLAMANHWPRRVRCPACTKKRSIERDTCEHCGTAWPEPKREGTEIFENSEATKV